MKIVIALHSTTGNTRIVTRFAASHLRSRGHECEVIDVVKNPEPPDLTGVDLLGLAGPTMYLRPTFTLERYASRIPNAGDEAVPAFLLNSCGGMPGAYFAMLSELLGYKGYVTLGGYWVLAPSNWPPHVVTMKKIVATEPLSVVAAVTPRKYRWVPALFWEKMCHPDEQDRDDLVTFLDDILHRAQSPVLEEAPLPSQLHEAIPLTITLGRIIPREFPDRLLRFHIDRSRCTACGTCVNVCSEGIIVRGGEDEVPTVTGGCSGCYACFNRCPEGALSDSLTQPGVGQYKAPPRTMRELFRHQDS